jgi:macrolide transport system ATP-binding/permease protein
MCIKEFDGSYKEYVNTVNKPKVSNEEKVKKEKLLLAQIKLSEIISLLSIEKDLSKKEKLEYQYNNLLKEIRIFKN